MAIVSHHSSSAFGSCSKGHWSQGVKGFCDQNGAWTIWPGVRVWGSQSLSRFQGMWKCPSVFDPSPPEGLEGTVMPHPGTIGWDNLPSSISGYWVPSKEATSTTLGGVAAIFLCTQQQHWASAVWTIDALKRNLRFVHRIHDCYHFEPMFILDICGMSPNNGQLVFRKSKSPLLEVTRCQ